MEGLQQPANDEQGQDEELNGNVSPSHMGLQQHTAEVVQAQTPEETFVEANARTRLESDIVQGALMGDGQGEVPEVNWPTMGRTPINEFQHPNLATKCFPTLFPTGRGDPTALDRIFPVSEADGFRHLLKYADHDDDGNWRWRFASHARFTHWANNRLQRHRLLGQTKVFLQKTPEIANMRLCELRDAAARGQAHGLLQKMYRYGANVTGSDPYWYKKRQELEAIFNQEGAATVFFTFTAADNHWHDLHRHMPSGADASIEKKVEAVRTYPHVTDWYFTKRLDAFLDRFFDRGLGVAWRWHRIEYQSRGSAHGHGCAKLKNDPGLIELTAKAWAGEYILIPISRLFIIPIRFFLNT